MKRRNHAKTEKVNIWNELRLKSDLQVSYVTLSSSTAAGKHRFTHSVSV